VAVVEGDAGGTAVAVAVGLDVASGRDVTVAWSSADGSALAGEDYQAASGALTIPAGAVSAEIVLAVVGDLVDEGDESFSVVLSQAEQATLGTAAVTVTVLDDDFATISVGDAEVLEGGEGDVTALAFAVELSTPADRPIQIDWTAVAGSAEAAVDFALAAGTVTFEVGATVGELTVEVLGDGLLEDDESFTVELSNPVGAPIGDPSGVGTIRDDEACLGPNLLSNPGAEAALEGGEIPGWTEVEGTEWLRWEPPPEPAEGEASFYAGLPGAGGWAELVQEVDLSAYAQRIDAGGQEFLFAGAVRTFDEQPPDVARIVVEYLDATGTAVLASWDSGDLSSPLGWTPVGDQRAVPPATRRVRIRLIATLFAGDTVDGLFDALSLRARRAPALIVGVIAVSESDPEAVFTLSLTCPWEHEIALSYGTADGTATAGEDYVATSGALALAAGETAATVAVPLLADEIAEGEETFALFVEDVSAAQPVVLLEPVGVATLVEVGSCRPEPFGTAHDFNVFVFEAVGQSGTDVEGRLAAGSSAQLSNYSVGFALPAISGDVLVVGGDLIFNGGTVHHGDIAVGGTAQLSSVNIADGTLRQDSPIDFAAEQTRLSALSAHLAALPANGTTDIPPWKAIQFTGGDPELNVFEVPGSELAAASQLAISVPAGSSVLVNVDGSTASMQFFGFALTGVDASRVVYHFPAATSLVMQGIGVEGSILAPLADVQFNNGQINGTLVARSLQGNGQSNLGLFAGCLPLPSGADWCPRSPGYWKNHPEAWPVSELTLGGVVYDQAEVQAILEYGGPDAATKLARALAATRLNVASGFQHPDLPTAITEADAFLALHPPGSNPKGSAKGEGNALKDALEAFYEGVSCE
jgi:choice-of-anchor A domain-containing protein